MQKSQHKTYNLWVCCNVSLLVQIAAIVTENNNPQLPNINIHILRTFFFTFDVTNKENLFDNQEFLRLAIISYILMTFKLEANRSLGLRG